jgi:hypothetical protein
MDVICEDAAAALAGRVAGAHPREVWLAVIHKVFDCGFKTNEQLEGITTEQVVAVVQALSDSRGAEVRVRNETGLACELLVRRGPRKNELDLHVEPFGQDSTKLRAGGAGRAGATVLWHCASRGARCSWATTRVPPGPRRTGTLSCSCSWSQSVRGPIRSCCFAASPRAPSRRVCAAAKSAIGPCAAYALVTSHSST